MFKIQLSESQLRMSNWAFFVVLNRAWKLGGSASLGEERVAFTGGIYVFAVDFM